MRESMFKFASSFISSQRELIDQKYKHVMIAFNFLLSETKSVFVYC